MTGPNGSEEALQNTELSIEERKGAVVMWIGDQYLILPPDQACGIGEILLRYGHHAKTGKEKGGTKVLASNIIRKLENRVMLVITDLQEKKKRPLFIAQEIVNIVLREVK